MASKMKWENMVDICKTLRYKKIALYILFQQFCAALSAQTTSCRFVKILRYCPPAWPISLKTTPLCWQLLCCLHDSVTGSLSCFFYPYFDIFSYLPRLSKMQLLPLCYGTYFRLSAEISAAISVQRQWDGGFSVHQRRTLALFSTSTK